MLTVADALKLKEFHGARVVAGAQKLDNPIAWVHSAGVPDAPAWLNGGELVLTTALNMPTDRAEQIAYVEAMAGKGVAALALAVGRYIAEAPQHMRETAEAHGLPLIEIPFQARFIDIAKVINGRIVQENMAMVERALHIHRTLTQLVLDGGDLNALAEKLAGLVGQSVSIETERFEALASANIAPVDEARRYTLSEGHTDPRLIHALEDRGVLDAIRRTLRPVHIPQMADVGLEMERILAPVVVHGDIYGYVWIIADDRPLNDLDRLAIESGATIAALILLHQEAVLTAEASLKGGLVSQLLQADRASDPVLTDQALRYGLDLSAPFVLLVLQTTDQNSQKLLSMYRRMNRLTERGAVVSQFAGQVLMLAQLPDDLSEMVERVLTQGNGGLRLGVSGRQRGANRVAAAYQQAVDALAISARLEPDAPTVYFEALGYLHALYRAGAASLDDNPFVPALRKLRREQQADLFYTLENYLDEGGNGVAAAERLSIHRSTLNYRLARIAEVLEADLSDPGTRTNLQVALKLVRMFEAG